MRTLIRIIPLIFFAFLNAAEIHTFTDVTTGRTVDAEVVDVNMVEVKIKRDADGRVFNLPLERITENDKKYVSNWKKRQDDTVPVELRIEVSTFTEDVDKTQSSSTNYKVTTTGYTITVFNKSTINLENLKVTYVIYKDSDSRSGIRPDVSVEGTANIAGLLPGENTRIKTQTVQLSSSKLKANWYYGDTNERKFSDRLAGIWVKIYKPSGMMVGEYISSDKLRNADEYTPQE